MNIYEFRITEYYIVILYIIILCNYIKFTHFSCIFLRLLHLEQDRYNIRL